MSQKLFLTGEPGVGKSTIFQKIVTELGDKCVGFYTPEVLVNGEREGFDLVSINLPVGNGPLARLNSNSPYQLGRWGVDITHLEKITNALENFKDTNKIFVIDEIAPMEAFSDKFRLFIENLLASDKTVIATIKLAEHPWCDTLKSNFNIPLKTATPENRASLAKEILAGLKF